MIYNEREKCYDEFSNLLSKFQTLSKSDVDGLRALQFFKNEMPSEGFSVSVIFCTCSISL